MTNKLRTLLIVVPVGLALLIGGAFLVDTSRHADEIVRNTSIGGVDVSGLTVNEAISVLQTHQDTLGATPFEVSVRDNRDTVVPSRVGLTVDIESAVTAAIERNRGGTVFSRFAQWFGNFGGTEDLDLSTEVNHEVFVLSMESLSDTLVNDPPFNGGIGFIDGALAPLYPTTGRVLDVADALQKMAAEFQAAPRSPIVLSDQVKEPLLTQDHITAGIREAQRLLGGPITLRTPDPDKVLTITEEQLKGAFEAVVDVEQQRITFSFDEDFLTGLVEPIADSLATEPVDAEMLFLDDGTVEIVPGRSGTTVDLEQLAEVLTLAGNRSDRSADLPVLVNAAPSVTAEELENLGITHLVSKFTTYHPPGQDRVVNIQTMAGTVNGTIVAPGEVFSLNGVVGQRTLEKGYLPAGTIVMGEHIDTVGGGVSQFATTTYNAMFWAGLEDVSHQPHTEYFTRYPVGIEATVNWPELDLKFRNDTDKSIMVRTSFEPNSLSVYIWGDNDGRYQEGEQSRGTLHTSVVTEGGSNARRVTATVSGRYGDTEPGIRYDENPEIEPGIDEPISPGRAGWSVKVVRFIEVDGVATEQEWFVRYLSAPEVFERHPCYITGEMIDCPPTTTVPATEPPPTVAP